MKSFLKLIFCIFILVLSFWLEPNSLHASVFQAGDYIRKSPSEEVVLISNNFSGGEIFSYEDNSSTNSSGNSPQVLSFNFEKDILEKNNAQLIGSFIHNLLTNLNEVHQIRAP